MARKQSVTDHRAPCYDGHWSEYLVITAYTVAAHAKRVRAVVELCRTLAMVPLQADGTLVLWQSAESEEQRGVWFPPEAAKGSPGLGRNARIHLAAPTFEPTHTALEPYLPDAETASVYADAPSNALSHYAYEYHVRSSDIPASGPDRCDGNISVHINTTALRGQFDMDVRAFVDRVVDILAGTAEAFYGHVEIASGRDLNYGQCYDCHIMHRFASWHRAREDRLWMSLPRPRTSHVRGVYWGNLLGPQLAAKFLDKPGRLESFVEGFPERHITMMPYARRLEGGGLFVALSGTPSHMSYRYWPCGEADRSSVPLHHAFREAGILL